MIETGKSFAEVYNILMRAIGPMNLWIWVQQPWDIRITISEHVTPISTVVKLSDLWTLGFE